MLLFHNAPEECCAIPLELVERIEHINQNQIEKAGNRRTMQYRGQNLPLMSLKDTSEVGEFAVDAELVVIVMTRANRSIGLLAAQPVDVIEMFLQLDRITHRQKGISGSCIIGKDTTLLVDVDEIASAVFEINKPDAILIAEQPDSKSGPSSNGKATILLVEDSGFFRSQVGKYLEDDGYRVLSAEDGQVGWDMLRQNAADVRLVVTDIEMPNMNGLDLTRRIKADPGLTHLPIIALTTLADEEDISAGMAAGVTAYEVKLDKEKLLTAVHKQIQ